MCIRVVEGAVPESTELLKQRFDHIFYTGNAMVGRIVMRAAAEHLTPVTLELGGKSPCFIDDDLDLEVAASRVVWAKFYNCGQTCVAPDYLLVKESVYQAFMERLIAKVREFYGPDPSQCEAYSRIVNQRHFRRIMKLLEGSGDVLCGGTGVEQECYIAPTVLENVPEAAPVMEEEIFGPVLPVIKVANVEEAIGFINRRPKPLALYIFTNNELLEQKILEATSSGAVVVNHCMLHNLSPELPFGGVGESGMGAYHGKFGFDTLTHQKSVLKKPFAFDVPFLYPTHSVRLAGLVERLLGWWRRLRGI